MFDATVIGGGFAGLSAAVALGGAGARVQVLEARPEAGGRASSFRDPQTGELVDNGQHLVLGCYHETFAFLRAIGGDRHVTLQRDLTVPFVDPEGRRTTLQCPPLLPPWHLLGGVLDWDALSWADRLSAFGLAKPLRIARNQVRGRTSQLAASPGETVEGWLVRNGQSERLRLMLWDPLSRAALNQSPGKAAAPAFAAVLGRMFGHDPRDAAIGMPSRPLSSLYVEPARAFIEAHAGVVRCHAPARVRVDPGGTVGVEIRGEGVEAGAVIVAVPWHALAETIDDQTGALDATLRAAAATHACPIVTVNVWLDRRVMDGPFVGLPGREMQWAFDKEQILPGAASHLSLVSSGAEATVGLPDDAIVRLAIAEIRQALPAARGAGVRHAVVTRERQATYSLAPGQPARPATMTAVGGLYLAGDWIETGMPATIEGAVLSGHRAAAAVLGRRRPL